MEENTKFHKMIQKQEKEITSLQSENFKQFNQI